MVLFLDMITEYTIITGFIYIPRFRELTCPLIKSICNGGEWIAGRMQRFSSVLSKFTYGSRVSMLSLSITFYFQSLSILHSDTNYLSNFHISCSQKENILTGRFPFAHVKSGRYRWGFFKCFPGLRYLLFYSSWWSHVTDLWSDIFGWLPCSFSCSTFCFKFSLSWENTWFWILGACSMWCWKRWSSLFSTIFLYITRLPQTSFEDKVVWFSFLNSIFISIWPRCWWHGMAHLSTLLLFWLPVRIFWQLFFFLMLDL